MSRIPDDGYVLIVGAMKCGTSTLFSLLAQHPEICGSEFKEPEYFSENQAHRHRVSSYESLWPNFDPARHKYALEGSTGYTKWPIEQGVAARIRSSGIRPKLIYVVRDPVARIESHFQFIQLKGGTTRQITDPYLVDVSRYMTQIRSFLDEFGEDSLMVLSFDDLTTDPASVVERVQAFLGLTAVPIATEVPRNETSALRSSRAKRAVRKIGWLRKLAGVVPRRRRDTLERMLARVLPAPTPSRTVLGPAERQRVRSELAPEMTELSRRFDIDVSAWGFTR